jgi:hypothetical protein
MALQRIVKALSDGEELVLSHDDLPFGKQAYIVHERHKRLQNLGHAASVGRRINVQDAGAFERLCGLPNPLYYITPNYRFIISQTLALNFYLL